MMQGTVVGLDMGWWRRRQTRWWGTGTRRRRRQQFSSGSAWQNRWLPCSPSSSARSLVMGLVLARHPPLPSSGGQPPQHCRCSPLAPQCITSLQICTSKTNKIWVETNSGINVFKLLIKWAVSGEPAPKTARLAEITRAFAGIHWYSPWENTEGSTVSVQLVLLQQPLWTAHSDVPATESRDFSARNNKSKQSPATSLDRCWHLCLDFAATVKSHSLIGYFFSFHVWKVCFTRLG